MARSAAPPRTRAQSRSTSRRRPTRGRRLTPRLRRERARRWRIAIITVFAVGVLALVAFASVVVLAALTSLQELSLTPALRPPTAATAPAAPAAPIYNQDQRDNAAIIMAAGRDLGLSVRDQAIGVMTAMGESSLRNIDYGDWETSGVTNPDGSRTTSIGLFQQQDSWGTREERLDPYTAATLFYRAMQERVPDRESVAPTLVAHDTQINEDPNHYARYWPQAVELLESISGVESGLEG